MKNYILILIAAMTLFACKKADKGRELPGDPELVNVEMDRQAAAKRKYPPKNPPTQKKGCLLLDFNGEEVTNTIWNSNGDLSCAGSGLSSTQIANVLARVKYDFSQFDLEVTTDEARYNLYPQNKRRRCIITTTNFYGNVGGVAFINSFNWFDDTPCFVFSQLLNYNEKYVSDATSHELGHTAGCRHHVELRNDESGICYVYSQYLQSNHIMSNCYNYSNPLFTSGYMYCGELTNDITNINNSINL